MTTRSTKILLLAAIALFYTLVVLNNVTDFDSNYEFVRHVLSMDTTFPGNKAMWRAMDAPLWHLLFYWGIIGWEAVTMVVAWWGAWCLFKARKGSVTAFEGAKRVGMTALTLSMLMWLVAFLTVGAEWFLMWQSKEWNGQDAAFRMFVVVGVVMLVLIQRD
jgi:predicted small integral membrane protein